MLRWPCSDAGSVLNVEEDILANRGLQLASQGPQDQYCTSSKVKTSW
jgi:hypothetical protein